jgi:hypothetical protein
MLGRLGSSVARRHHVTHTMAAARTLSSLPIPYTASKEGPFKTGDSTAPSAPPRRITRKRLPRAGAFRRLLHDGRTCCNTDCASACPGLVHSAVSCTTVGLVVTRIYASRRDPA